MYHVYYVKHEDGHEYKVITDDIMELLFKVQEEINKHGESISCNKELSYNKWTGSKFERIW